MELDDKQNKLGELSKGMQQKVSICFARFLPAPKVVMLDEPLVGLDPTRSRSSSRCSRNCDRTAAPSW